MEKKRLFGLDVLRVSAISLVLCAQVIWIFSPRNNLLVQAAGVFHYIGLEVFFVLSGFLIGLKLYPLYLNQSFGTKTVFIFVKRRLLQIFPLYLLCLFANIGIAVYAHHQIDTVWKYFLLIQNFAKPMPAFFAESWGIAVLIWSSVLFPFILLLLDKLRKPNNRSLFFVITVLLLIVASLFLKLGYNSVTKNSDIMQWNSNLRSVAIYRFDGVLIGILIAWLVSNYTVFLRKSKVIFAVLGALGLAFLFAGVGFFQLMITTHRLFWNVLYLPLTSFIIGAFFPILYQWRPVLTGVEKGMASIAKITYAIYLLHWGIMWQILTLYFPYYSTSPTILAILIVIWSLLTLAAAIAVYQFVQLKLLNKWQFNRNMMQTKNQKSP